MELLRLMKKTNRSNPKEAGSFMEGLVPPRTIYSPIFHLDKRFDEGSKTPELIIKSIKIKHDAPIKCIAHAADA